MVDLVTIGAGGGSIARVSATGRADRRAAERRRRAGTRLLRAAAATSRPSRTRISRSGICRPTCSAAASRSMSRRPARRSRQRIAEPLGHERRGRRARHPCHRRQQHGRRHPRGVGRARPRSARLLAAALRRRRAAARRRRWRACSACRPSWCRRRPGVLSALGLLVSNLKAEFSAHLRCRRPAPSMPARSRASSPSSMRRRRAWLDAEERAGTGAADRLAREPALSAPGLRALRALGRARGHGGRSGRDRRQPSTACTSGFTPSLRRTRRSRS